MLYVAGQSGEFARQSPLLGLQLADGRSEILAELCGTIVGDRISGQWPVVIQIVQGPAELGLLADAAALELPVPVVVMGARLAVEDLVAALRTGVCDVVFKPLTASAVLAAYQRARRRLLPRVPGAERPGQTPPAPATGPPSTDRRWHWHPAELERPETQVTIPLVGDYELVEEQLVEQVVGRYAGNKAAAARALGMHRRTLYRVLARQQTKRPENAASEPGEPAVALD